MQKNKRISYLVIILSLAFTCLKAQEGVSNGGSASGSGGNMSFSVGQVVYSTYSGTNGSVSEGVQQPYEISVVSGIENKNILLSCIVFPNPTTEYVTLELESIEVEGFSYQLFDITGKMIENKLIENNQMLIRMNELVPATYLLKVIKEKKEIKVFKIVKN